MKVDTTGGTGGRPVVLLVGGTDPSGGAGVAADLKAVAAMGGHGCLAVTAVTVQNSGEVRSWTAAPAEQVAAQIEAVADDGGFHAVKSGMLGRAETVEALARLLDRRFSGVPYVLDPVMVAGSGDSLGRRGLVEAVREELVPRCALCTPNLGEAEKLVGAPVRDVEAMKSAGRELCRLGAGACLVKGGHLEGDPIDVLVWGAGCPDAVGGSPQEKIFENTRLGVGKVHGTGCTLASAVATLLGAGFGVRQAVVGARRYLQGALQASFLRANGKLLGHFPGIGEAPPARRRPDQASVDDGAYYGEPKFCARCGRELQALPDLAPHRGCVACGYVAYRNPLPVVAVVVRREQKLLVVRRARAPKIDELCLPGGFLEVGESLEACARRELFEETHLEAGELKLLGVDTDDTAYGSMTFTFFEALSVRGQERAGDDAAEVLWRDLDELSSLAFRSHTRLLERLGER